MADESPEPNGSNSENSAVELLIVEDDPVLRLLIRNLLEGEGYSITEADNRLKAIELLKSNQNFAAVLLDLGLPPVEHSTMEGLAVLKMIQDSLHPAKVVVLTGQDEEKSALAAIRAGAFDFLSKPSKSEDILNAVNRALMFYQNERALAQEGLTLLQINAKVGDGLKAVREEAEEKLVKQVLKDTNFNIYQSAAKLGLKRESIYYFLKKFGIRRDDS